ncbi:MAG: MarR family transcriptional regulator [Cryobacterium sp.]|uniref:MarR family winged helix-turn-helix transcriptional regulator n=1 Tax=unclassified Cryobacterium TaxID=2649013 RepID=UPI0018C93393|nr:MULTISPECIES: MarR family transcriptional regulator [unclassified Cryobacterium]MCY7403572.1 MarR family transcriptional regulator [Cryobacterium sp.]MEC5154277.1 DNA-binding MarR family transcriptional regulator [Cryobacterium sp. CAN_C3]
MTQAVGNGSLQEGFSAPLAGLIGALTDLERQLTQGLNLALSEENTTLDQWRIMEALARLDSPTMGDLAEVSGMANATLSRTVDSLEDAASAFRLPTVSDRRRITVHLSDHGTQRLVRVREIIAAWERSTEGKLGVDDAAALVAAAHVVTRRLRAAPGD